MSTATHKYLIVIPVPNPQRAIAHFVMGKVSLVTGLPAPYTRLVPHITLHRPFASDERSKIEDIIRACTKKSSRMPITTGRFFPFEKDDTARRTIVLPIHPTIPLASLWVNLHDHLARLPGYQREPSDEKNSLHITVATVRDEMYDTVWDHIISLEFFSIGMTLDEVALYQQPVNNSENKKWEKIATFPLP